MTEYRHRELSGLVQEALKSLPVVVVTGLRQAGKTTLLRKDPHLQTRRYVSLDDFAALEAARREPEALIEGETPVTIDEVQRCPELLTVIKRAVDRRRRPGQFLLSGSANLALLKDVSESLAGRSLYLALHPFTRRERTGRLSAPPFVVAFMDAPAIKPGTSAEPIGEEEILDGGMPPVVVGEARRRDLWFLGYEQTYLERDVRDLSQVADLVTFRNLLRLAALRSGQILNQSELARDAKLPAETVRRYLGLMETSFVLSRLAPHLRSRASRLIKSPKVFLSDSGLAAHLTGVTDLSAGADEPLRGALFETYALQNLAGILAAHRPQAELGFWSVQGRHEVDFVLSTGRSSIAIEVKAGSRFGDRDLAGLRAFAAATPGFRAGILAYNGTDAHALSDDLFAIPLGLLLS